MHACSAHSLRHARNELVLLGLSRRQLAGLLTRQFPHLPAAEVAALAPTAATAVLPSTHAAFVTTLHTRLMNDANPAADRDDAGCLASIVAHACLRPIICGAISEPTGATRYPRCSIAISPRLPRVTSLTCAGRNSLQEVAAALDVPPETPVPGLRGFRLLLFLAR